MDIKKHYKILIAILIAIILISSFIIYDITSKKNINYNNNVDKINVKYFNVGYTFPYIKNNYSISSNYINNNKISYLNSTIIYPRVLPYVNSCINFGINIHLNNVNNLNNKYLYLDINSKLYPGGYDTCLSNLTFINSKYINNVYEIKYKINGNNIFINSITITDIDHYIVNNKYYNTSIKIGLNNNFYNLFNINTIKENAIYGITNYTNSPIRDVNISNTYVYIEDVNNNNIYKAPIKNGYFYFFAQPDTEYRFYSYENNTFKLLNVYNDSGKLVNEITTNNAGNSTNVDMMASDF